MRKIVIILSLMFFFNKAYAQDYTPMFEIDKAWNFYVSSDTPGGYYFDLEVTETVEIESLTYYHIKASHNNCETFLREDIIEKKIYGIWEGEEYLHYDFSLDIGDQMWIGGDYKTITDIGYGDFYGIENLKYFVLDNNYKLIEGIGFESVGIADSFEYYCLYNPPLETFSLIGMNQPLANSDNALDEISIYPNPVKELLNFESSYSVNEIQIYNSLGLLVMKQQYLKNQINISNLSSGLFFIKIKTDQGTITKKIIKE